MVKGLRGWAGQERTESKVLDGSAKGGVGKWG